MIEPYASVPFKASIDFYVAPLFNATPPKHHHLHAFFSCATVLSGV